jgi:DNA-binding transcriptional regulator YiaG
LAGAAGGGERMPPDLRVSVGTDMKKAKRKRTSPRSATAADAYIGAQMRKRRLAVKMKQEDLAKALGVTKQQVQKYEAGQNRVSAARLFDICGVLKVSLSSMFKPDQAPP